MIRLVILSALAAMALWSGPVWAQDPVPPRDPLAERLYETRDPIHKLGRGVVNVLTGWIEVPKQIHLGSQEDNPVTGIGGGLLKGIARGLLRTGVGVYEAVTFPIPYPRGYASPYGQMELNDYAWE
jgi:putative exosortase-associated protein (TIGR04073 family)